MYHVPSIIYHANDSYKETSVRYICNNYLSFRPVRLLIHLSFLYIQVISNQFSFTAFLLKT